MRLLFLLTACCIFFQVSAKESSEAFSFSLPENTKWKSRQALYNPKAHTGHIELVPFENHSLTSKEYLTISWTPYRGIHPTKQKAAFIDSLRRGSHLKVKTRTLWHQGESVAFEIQEKQSNENRYQLIYIGHLFPYNVTVSYINYDAKDTYALRETYFPLFKNLAHNDAKKGFSVSHRGIFINNEPIQQADQEQLCQIQEPVILKLPSSWKIDKTISRKDKAFEKDQCFIRGKTEKCDFTFSLEHKAERSKELYTYIDAHEHAKDKVWGYDEREIMTSMSDSAFTGIIPGAYECYQLKVEGNKEDISEEKELIISTLKHITGPYLKRQD